MKITLTIIHAPSSNPITGFVISLGDGESIGRAASNQLVLADDSRVISSRHAEIKLQGSELLLVDQSTNGTFLNNSAQAMGKGNSVPLQTGDLITIGEYQLSVSVEAAANFAAPAPTALPEGLESVGFLDNALTPPPAVSPPVSAPPTPAQPSAPASDPTPAGGIALDDFDKWLEPAPSNRPSEHWGSVAPNNLSSTDPLAGISEPAATDPLAAFDKAAGNPLNDPLGGGFGNPDDDNWWQTDLDNTPANQQAMPSINIQQPPGVPPSVPPGVPATPAHPQPSVGVPPTPPAPVHPTNPPMSTAGMSTAGMPTAGMPTAGTPTAVTSAAIPQQAAELAALLGLPDLTPDQQAKVLPTSANIIRSSIENLVSLLQSRASIKNELRASRTIIKSTENNPLKFSAGASDAMKAMYANDSAAFLSAERAVEESFEDIADHQIAVLFATKAAFDEMLSHFHPDELAMKVNTPTKGVLSNLKPKTWEKYCEYYEQLQSDRETSYNQLFGEAFARAYEAKLTELKTSRSLSRNQ